jgi:hypothetical protein
MLGGFDSIAAFAGAPFARLAEAREADLTENLSALVAGFGDVHTMLGQ